jgi:hypothetical protein
VSERRSEMFDGPPFDWSRLPPESQRRIMSDRRIYTKVIEDELFPDGYCDCRCGPVHHKIWYDESVDAVIVCCKYHKRECGRVSAVKIRAYIEGRP